MRLGVIRGLAVAVAISLAMVLLAACGEEEAGAPATPETPAAETPAGETPGLTPEGEMPAGETPVADASELQKLAQAAEAITAKITYDYSSTFSGQTTEGTWTLVQRPPDLRMDFSGTQEGLEYTLIVINAGGKSYLCTGLEGDEQCLLVEEAATREQTGIFQPILNVSQTLAESPQGLDLQGMSEREIAGVSAKCFQVKAIELSMFLESEACFSEEGVLLAQNTKVPQGEITIEATDFTTDVTDEDFEPPFEMMELP